MTKTPTHRERAFFVPAFALTFDPLFLLNSFWTSPTGFPKLVNLIIFLTIFYLLIRKGLQTFFAQRLTTVRETLDKAAREKQDATAKMKELDTRLNRVDAELAEIKEQSKREAAAERVRMETEARKDIEKVREMAAREIEIAKQVAMSDLREFAATKSVDLAEQMIRRELTPADDAKLVQRAGEQMSKAK